MSAENRRHEFFRHGSFEAPLPGNVRIPFDELKGTLKYALTEIARNLQAKKAA